METQCTPTFDTSCSTVLQTAYKQVSWIIWWIIGWWQWIHVRNVKLFETWSAELSTLTSTANICRRWEDDNISRSHSRVHIRTLILENLHGCPDPEMCSCPSQGGGGEVCQYPDSDLSECSSCGQCPCPPETVLQKAKVSLVIDFDTTSCSLFHLRKVCQTLVSTKPKVVIERIPKTVCPHDQPLTEKSGPTPKVNDQKNNFLTRK